jgi:hypothetical protein
MIRHNSLVRIHSVFVRFVLFVLVSYLPYQTNITPEQIQVRLSST